MTTVSHVSQYYDFLYQKILCKRPIDISYNIIILVDPENGTNLLCAVYNIVPTYILLFSNYLNL